MFPLIDGWDCGFNKLIDLDKKDRKPSLIFKKNFPTCYIYVYMARSKIKLSICHTFNFVLNWSGDMFSPKDLIPTWNGDMVGPPFTKRACQQLK